MRTNVIQKEGKIWFRKCKADVMKQYKHTKNQPVK